MTPKGFNKLRNAWQVAEKIAPAKWQGHIEPRVCKCGDKFSGRKWLAGTPSPDILFCLKRCRSTHCQACVPRSDDSAYQEAALLRQWCLATPRGSESERVEASEPASRASITPRCESRLQILRVSLQHTATAREQRITREGCSARASIMARSQCSARATLPARAWALINLRRRSHKQQ